MFIHIPLVFTLGFRTFLFFAVGCRMFIHSFNVFVVDFGMVIQIFVVLLLVFVYSFTYFLLVIVWFCQTGCMCRRQKPLPWLIQGQVKGHKRQ